MQKPEFEKLMLRAEVRDMTVGLRVTGKPKPVDASREHSPIRDEVCGIVVRYADKRIKFTQDVIGGDIEKAAALASRRVYA